MNKDTLLNYSKSYCKIRIPIGIFFTVFLAFLLLFVSFKGTSVLDSKKLTSTKGKVTSGKIVRYRSVYFPELSVTYNVNDKQYVHTSVFYQHNFLSKESAQKFLDSMLEKEIPIFYEKQNPEMIVFFVEEIQLIVRFLKYFSILLFFFAGIMYLLKDNPIFCGLTIFSDILSVFRMV